VYLLLELTGTDPPNMKKIIFLALRLPLGNIGVTDSLSFLIKGIIPDSIPGVVPISVSVLSGS
jgi:hypothetical protein